MATISFQIQSKNSPANIYMRFRDTILDIKIKTGLFVNPADWTNKKKGRPLNSKSAEGKKLKGQLSLIESNIVSKLNDVEDINSIDSFWLSAILDKAQTQEVVVPSNLNKFLDYYFAKQEEFGKDKRALQKVNSNLAMIRRFVAKKRRGALVKDVNLSFADDFVLYLKNDCKYGEGYIFRTIKFLKTVCLYARREGVQTSPQVDMIKGKNKKSPLNYLSPEEIGLIKQVKLPSERLENARDWLLISCYCGTRVSDLMHFTQEMILTTSNGNRIISFHVEKTDNPLMVYIFPEVEEILSKRNGNFPRPLSDQNYNDYCKEVGLLAGLTKKEFGSIKNTETNRKVEGMYEKWELISSHIGRRSFATNYYGKYPTALLMAQTGHKTERSFLEYIGKSRMDQVEALAELIKLKK